MKRIFCSLALALFAGATLAQAPEVTLTRIDCGTGAKPTNVGAFNPALQGSFSDTHAYKDTNVRFRSL